MEQKWNENVKDGKYTLSNRFGNKKWSMPIIKSLGCQKSYAREGERVRDGKMIKNTPFLLYKNT